MKEEINLLPPPIRNARVRRLYRKGFDILLRRFVLGLLSIYVALIASWWVFWEAERKQASELNQAELGTAEVEKQVNRINTLLDLLDRRIAERSRWLTPTQEVVRSMPTGVNLKNLSVKAEEGTLTIRAVSSSRVAVLEWQKQLEDLPWVAHVEAPLQNFATGPEAAFTFVLHREAEL